MEKSKTKKQQRAEKPPLNVTGQLAMPRVALLVSALLPRTGVRKCQ
jgi:hypothetical protein